MRLDIKATFLLFICSSMLSCDNVKETWMKVNPVVAYVRKKDKEKVDKAKDSLSLQIVNNEFLYDSLFIKTSASTNMHSLKAARDHVQSFIKVSNEMDSISSNCDCKFPQESLKSEIPVLYSLAKNINKQFTELSTIYQEKSDINSFLLIANYSKEEWEKKLFQGVDTTYVPLVLLSQKVEVLAKEKEILENLIQHYENEENSSN